MEKIARVNFLSSLITVSAANQHPSFPHPPSHTSALVLQPERPFHGLSQTALLMSVYASGPLHWLVPRLQ